MKRDTECCFCHRPLEIYDDNNAEDYKLHPDTQGKSCCTRCNNLITIPNRCLSMYLQTQQKHYIYEAIRELQKILNENEKEI